MCTETLQLEMYKTAFAMMTDGVVLRDRSGRIVDLNTSAERILGASRDQLLGVAPADPRWHAARADGHALAEAEHPAMITLQTGEPQRDTLVRLDVPDGERKWLRVNSDLLRGHDGEVCGVIATFTDVTAETEARDRAQQSEREARRAGQFLSDIMANMSEAIVIVDQAGAITFANPAATNLVAQSGMTLKRDFFSQFALYDPEGHAEIPTQDRPAFRALRGETVDGQFVMMRSRTSDMTKRVVMSTRPITSADGSTVGALIVCRDVTEIYDRQTRLVDANRFKALGRVTSGVAHDFNNTLTAIASAADVITRLSDSEQVRALGQTIGRAAMQGGALTQQLLAFSRQLVLQPKRVDAHDLIRDAIALVEPLLGEKIAIIVALDAARPWIDIDPVHFTSALVNLAINARDAMPEGGALTFESRQTAGASERFTVSVRDTGVGVPTAIRERVFEPFFTTKANGAGTGLGLSMVHGFVRQSGGQISLESAEGAGTTIALTFPCSAAPAAQAASRTHDAAGGEGALVLVVEDNALVRDAVVMQVEELGYRTISARDGRSALTALERHGAGIDILFTDVSMPGGMSGPELAAEVRRRAPGTEVILTSGHIGDLETHSAQMSKERFLQKPFRREDLAVQLAQALAARRMRAQAAE